MKSLPIILLFIISGATAALADELTGLWSNSGSTAQGPYSSTVGFGNNNFFSYDFTTAGNPSNGLGGGTTRCEGTTYQYAGGYLSTQYSSCMACFTVNGYCRPSPLTQVGGQVTFRRPNVLVINGEAFQRN